MIIISSTSRHQNSDGPSCMSDPPPSKSQRRRYTPPTIPRSFPRPSYLCPIYAVLECSATKSITGATAYGQNITTATTGKYIKTVLPIRPAGLLKFHGAAAVRAVVYCLNCFADARWICVRVREERIVDRGAIW